MGRVEDGSDADGLGRVAVAKLGGHRQGDPIGSGQGSGERGQGARQFVGAFPELERQGSGLP